MNFKEIAKRSETGPLTEAKDFLMKSVAANAMRLSKEYDITWDGKTLINLDDDMADRCFQAGRELFINTGVYSMNSSRVVKFSTSEVDDALRFTRSQVAMGQGKDQVCIHHRQVEDARKPFIFCGPFNANVHEDMFVKLNEAFSQEKIVDCLFFPGYLNEVDGQLIRPTSALASRAAILYGQWAREAVRRGGRPGMAIAGHAVMAPGEIACTNEATGLRSTDPRAMVLISELQVDDVTLTRTAYYLAYGCPIYMAFTPLIGGYGGGVPGSSVVAVASFIASIMLGGEIVHMGPQHMKYKQQTNLHSLFLASLANQAVARNSNIIATTSHTTSGRPGSAQYAYEFSALALTAVTSGSNVSGPRPAEPLGNNNVSPLMGKLFAEVAHAAAGMSRDKATPIVEALYAKYKDNLDLETAPKGQPFEELYDLETLTPTLEHQALYDQVKEELVNLGIPLL
ncbi:monomethylamine:corrinoid methyltransferase [Candidatus Bipolaricaulota bacterium]|nr:monomethylamine:corrinoid methyltransferase [Candidatus Bipolaricaulota bacterium]